MQCLEFKKLKDWQLDKLRDALDKAKWFASERCGHDVGIRAAESEFFVCEDTNKLFDMWRKEYCGKLCAERDYCGLAVLFLQS